MRFYILDVFAESKYAGNQLAVVRDCAGLSGEEMLAITREMNYSETTFITCEDQKQGGIDVRIFTPGEELPFAGHPTLGTAYLIQQKIIGKQVEKVCLNLKVGQIPVTFNYENDKPGVLWMKQNAPVFGEIIEKEIMADILRLEVSDIDERFDVCEVSTGLPFIVVPLKNLDAVKRCRVNVDKFLKFIESRDAKNILVFAPETYNAENDLNVRVFCDYLGIPEDPATGSGNGCLAGFLSEYKYFGSDKVDVRVEQGYEINRKSLLRLRSKETNGKIEVHVGGKVVMIAEGKLI